MKMPVEPTADSLHPQHPGFQLVIERGFTRFPVRPISQHRFLIGAGSNCQLQLAGEVPMLHSIILCEADRLWIDAVAPHPQLFVNGTPIRDGQINQGDLIELGEYVFTVELQPAAEVSLSPADVKNNRPAAERSAAELFEHLENELAELEHFERSQRQAAAQLQEAVRLQIAPEQLQSQGDPRAAILKLLAELHDRSRILDQRELMLSQRAQQLAASQEELRHELARLSNFDEFEEPGDTATSRKSA